MQIKQFLAITLSAWRLEFLKPQDIDSPQQVSGVLGTSMIIAESLEEAHAKWKDDTHYILLCIIPLEFDLELSAEKLALAGAKAFQAQAAEIRAKAFKEAEVFEEKAKRLLAIEYTPPAAV